MKPTRGVVYALFAAAVALAMGWSVHNGFVYDDLPAIVQNTRVTDPARWPTIPHSPYWLGTLWRPLTVLMYGLQWVAGHGAPWFFHLVSLVGYFAVGIVLFRLLERMNVDRSGAAIATTLFLVHPVHVEAVANVVGQAELWVALSLTAATLIYLRARQDGTERRSLPALLAVTALGIMAKEQGFVLPLLLAAAEWLLLGGRNAPLRARIRLLVPVTGVAVLLFVVRGILLNDSIGENPAVALRALTPIGRLVTFFGVVPEWARLLVWPAHLQADYGPPGIPIGGPMTARHWLGVLLVCGFIASIGWARKRTPVAAFGLCWLAIAIAPVSNVLTPSGLIMAERVLFVPSIGLAIVLSALIRQPQRWTAWSMTAASAVVAWGVLMTVRSATRVPTWSTQSRFFSDITVDGANAYRGWKVSAEYWDDQGDRPRAIAQLKHSIDLWPHDFEVAERLGQVYRQDGHCDQAVPVFARGLEADSSATSLRAKLIECLITLKDWDRAQQVADEGVRVGRDEFKAMQERVKKLRGDQ